jgi:2-dehydro-3-deoxygalactonokinase
VSATARLIALDWGSTRLRAWLLGEGGAVLAERGSDDGASRIHGGAAAFDAALQALASDWLATGLPAIACGMVGSAHGWREAPYVACPARLDQLHQHLLELRTTVGTRLLIAPGLLDEPAGGTPDVMRGEETQIVGLLAHQPALVAACTVLMPGTHSKWVQLRQGRVVGLRTRMTGELYAVLHQHSVLGRMMPAADETFDDQAFDAGLAAARRGEGRDLGGQLFAVRTLGLTGRLAVQALPDYLSGLLIGHEVLAGLPCVSGTLALVGEATLCQRYVQALQTLGVTPHSVNANTASPGLWQIAHQAGVV